MMNFVVIFICLISGFLCKRIKTFPASTAQALNAFVIYLSLPALILAQIPKLLAGMSFEGFWWLPVSMAWLNFALSFLFFSLLGRKMNWSHPKAGALILTAGLGNTSFVGFPLLEALIGPHAIPIGILVDQPGTFLVLSTLGIVVAAYYSGTTVTIRTVMRRVLTFPPFLSLLVAVLWSLGGSPGFTFLSPAFEKVSATLVPLALFAVGFQLKLDFHSLQRRWMPLTAGLVFKLCLMPIVFAIFYMKILDGNDLSTRVTVLESAMAPMITSAVVASEFNLDSELANLMVGIGIPISILTVSIWSSVLPH